MLATGVLQSLARIRTRSRSSPRLPPVVRLLIAGTFVNKVGSFIVPFLTIVLRREFHLSERQVGWLLLAYGAGSLASILVGGALTDRLGRRFTLLFSLVGSGVIALALGFADSIRVFVPLLVLFGFMADLYRPAASSIIGDVLPSSQRASGFAAPAAGRQPRLRGRHVPRRHPGGLELARALPRRRPHHPRLRGGRVPVHRGDAAGGRPARRRTRRAGAAPWSDGVFLQLVAVSFVFAMIFFNHISTLPLTVTGPAGYPASVFGGLVAVNGLVIALFEMGTVERLRRFRRLRVAAVGNLLAGLGFALTGVSLPLGLAAGDGRDLDRGRDPEHAVQDGLHHRLGAAARRAGAT